MSAEQIHFEQRYDRLDEANLNSWYLNSQDRPFTVIMSVNGAGPARELNETGYITESTKAARFVLGGNMSSIRLADGKVPYGPDTLSDTERYHDALSNMQRHLESIGVDIARVRILNPERDYSLPLGIVNVDDDPGSYTGGDPVRLQQRGDFIYSYDQDTVLAVRPADCPIAVMSAETPRGKVNILTHFAWRGLASGQFEQMLDALDMLEIDKTTLRVYITPGGQAETYQYEHYRPDGKNNPTLIEQELFPGVKGDDSTGYSFGIDSPYFVYKKFLDAGFDPRQLFIDTSDTTRLDSGYSSHARSSRIRDHNTRDIVTMLPNR